MLTILLMVIVCAHHNTMTHGRTYVCARANHNMKGGCTAFPLHGSIRTHNTDLKKRLAAYAEQHPDVCRQTDADPETGCMEFDIEKGRFSFRLTAPYSEERREAARRYARESNVADRLK